MATARSDKQDRLRGQYHALSADPNSLANLDQDLPNSMQDQIPIFTLDRDWLWCQTWCSDESLVRAKTSTSAFITSVLMVAELFPASPRGSCHHHAVPPCAESLTS